MVEEGYGREWSVVRYKEIIHGRIDRHAETVQSEWPAAADERQPISRGPSFRDRNIGVLCYCAAAYPPYVICKCMNRQVNTTGSSNVLPWENIHFHDLCHTFI